MKKLFLLLSLMATISISAQSYKHSFGILVGSYNGLSIFGKTKSTLLAKRKVQ